MEMRSDSRETAIEVAVTRACDEAVAYAQYVEISAVSRALVDAARRVRGEAARTRALVVATREQRARDAEARTRLREAVREYVAELKRTGTSLDAALTTTGGIMHRLRVSGRAPDDAGNLEVEVQRMVAEAYFAAA